MRMATVYSVAHNPHIYSATIFKTKGLSYKNVADNNAFQQYYCWQIYQIKWIFKKQNSRFNEKNIVCVYVCVRSQSSGSLLADRVRSTTEEKNINPKYDPPKRQNIDSQQRTKKAQHLSKIHISTIFMPTTYLHNNYYNIKFIIL